MMSVNQLDYFESSLIKLSTFRSLERINESVWLKACTSIMH